MAAKHENDNIPLPPDLTSKDITHGYVDTSPGVKIHYVESGAGPAVILLHGFPESWYGYRHQIGPIAKAGYRVICPDQRGYGASSAPPNIGDYKMELITGDVIGLMDGLKIEKAILVGHDWGGNVAWNTALFYPDRFVGVCSINTPFMPANPSVPPSAAPTPPAFDYVLYFQTPGVAEKELELDLERSFRMIFQGTEAREGSTALENSSTVRQRGGLFVGMPDLPRSSIISEDALKYYAEQYKENGFRGPLNWYRNLEENWKWACSKAGETIKIPAMMVTSSHDAVLKHEFTLHMEQLIPHLKRLLIQKSSHWTMSERPDELNDGLIKWFKELMSSCTRF